MMKKLTCAACAFLLSGAAAAVTAEEFAAAQAAGMNRAAPIRMGELIILNGAKSSGASLAYDLSMTVKAGGGEGAGIAKAMSAGMCDDKSMRMWLSRGLSVTASIRDAAGEVFTATASAELCGVKPGAPVEKVTRRELVMLTDNLAPLFPVRTGGAGVITSVSAGEGTTLVYTVDLEGDPSSVGADEKRQGEFRSGIEKMVCGDPASLTLMERGAGYGFVIRVSGKVAANGVVRPKDCKLD